MFRFSRSEGLASAMLRAVASVGVGAARVSKGRRKGRVSVEGFMMRI
jgi:hypothetical protein